MTSARVLRLTHWVMVATVITCVVAAGAWRLTGGRWERVETPSMGTVAPVNTLLWVEPVRFGDLRVGDIITFHPPGDPSVTYSHRVAVVHEDGSVGTTGEISAPDPWRLGPADVVGRVVMRWQGVGWLVVAAPILLVGVAVVLLLRRLSATSWRLPVTIIGVSLVLSVAIVVHRPFVQAEKLGFAAAPGGARASYVSTGLLPLRLRAHDGPYVDLRDGQVGSVLVTRKDSTGRYGVTLHPHIPLWWWLLLVGGCFVPALWAAVVGVPNRPEPKRRATGS